MSSLQYILAWINKTVLENATDWLHTADVTYTILLISRNQDWQPLYRYTNPSVFIRWSHSTLQSTLLSPVRDLEKNFGGFQHFWNRGVVLDVSAEDWDVLLRHEFCSMSSNLGMDFLIFENEVSFEFRKEGRKQINWKSKIWVKEKVSVAPKFLGNTQLFIIHISRSKTKIWRKKLTFLETKSGFVHVQFSL